MGKKIQALLGVGLLALVVSYILFSEPATHKVPDNSGRLFPNTMDVVGDVWIVIPVALAFFLLVPVIANSGYLGIDSFPTFRLGRRQQLPHEEYEQEQRTAYEQIKDDPGLVDSSLK